MLNLRVQKSIAKFKKKHFLKIVSYWFYKIYPGNNKAFTFSILCNFFADDFLQNVCDIIFKMCFPLNLIIPIYYYVYTTSST